MSPAAKKLPKAKKKTSSQITAQKDGAAEVSNIVTALRRPFKDRDDVWPTRRRVRNREEEPPVPEAYTGTTLRHRSAELDFMVRQITALLSENKEQYVAYAEDESEAANRLSDEAQKAVSSLMEFLEDFHPIERHRLLIHDYQVADGVGIEKLTFNWDLYKKLEAGEGETKDWASALETYVKKNKELPVKRVVVDPLTCYWEFDIDGLVAVAEQGFARRSALKDTYADDMHIMNAIERIPVSENTQDDSTATIGGISYAGYSYGDPGDLVNITELWTRKEFFLLAEGEGGEREILIRQKHPFKRPPYFFAPGILTGSPNPLHKYKPLVYPMYQTTLELSMIRTARYNGAYLSSFKPFYVRYANGGAEQDEESGNIKIHFLMPGNEIPSIKGGELVPLDWTNLEDLVQVEQSIMGDRDRFGFQAILAGNQGASGDSTAWETRTLRNQGMIQFNQVLRNYAQMREEEIDFILNIVKNVMKTDLPIIKREFDQDLGRGKTTIQYITTKIAEAGMKYQVVVSAGNASDKIAMVEEYRRGREAGEMTLRDVLRDGWGVQNVGERMDEIADEAIWQLLLPEATKTIIQVAMAGALTELKKYLPEDQAPDPEAITAQQQQAAAALAGQPGQEPPALGAAAANAQAQVGQGPEGIHPPSGRVPGGVVDPGMNQGLDSQQLPPDNSMPQPMMH